MNVTPDAKPQPRYRASTDEWHVLRAEKLSGQACRVCGRPAASLHHLVLRGQGGDDVADNLIPVCGHGTAGCHGLLHAADETALRRIGETLLDTEIGYARRKLGRAAGDDFLHRRYDARLDGTPADSPSSR